MLYCVYDLKYPIEYLLCGNLVSKDGFVHMKRTADYWVFITVLKGTLHITQNGIPYDVHANESILLLANTYHYGHKASNGELSYYWVHFHITDPNYQINNFGTLNRILNRKNLNDWLINGVSSLSNGIIPVKSLVASDKLSVIFFSQLLTLAMQDQYLKSPRCHYAANLLMTQITMENMPEVIKQSSSLPKKLATVIDWISLHYPEPITASSVAEQFNYNPSYLSTLFKEYTGRALTDYINNYRITTAKNLLDQSEYNSLSTIAHRSGFSDEKYFMRMFKKYTHMTPTEYKNAIRLKPNNLI